MTTVLTTVSAVPRAFIHNGKVYREENNELYSGWREDTSMKLIDANQATFTWKGSKMSWALWQEICHFLRWSQKTYKEEALVTLFYHQEQKIWAADVFPQEPNGMTVKSLDQDPEYKEVRKAYGKGWIQAGSIHHHCNANAFQSGTDTADEIDRDGLHITLGKMEEKEMDIHLRAVFDGVQYPVTPGTWIMWPDWMRSIPTEFHATLDYRKVFVLPSEGEFPAVWKTRIKVRKPTHTVRHFPGPTTVNHHASEADLKKTEGGKTGAASGTPTTRSEATGADDELDLHYQSDDAYALADAARRQRAASIPTFTDFDKVTMGKIHEIASDLSLDLTYMYLLLSHSDLTSMSVEDKIMRDEIFVSLKHYEVNPLLAMTLLEKLGV